LLVKVRRNEHKDVKAANRIGYNYGLWSQRRRFSALVEVVSRLARSLKAECIYLFGSQASGLAEPGSDYDVLVVGRIGFTRHQRGYLMIYCGD
jgi:predicted nucleotidyltransferase